MYSVKRSPEKESAEMVAEMLNNFSFSGENFCKEMCYQHKTLQQSFTRLCLKWLETCASDKYNFDGRNEASHTVAKELLKDKDEVVLPLV